MPLPTCASNKGDEVKVKEHTPFVSIPPRRAAPTFVESDDELQSFTPSSGVAQSHTPASQRQVSKFAIVDEDGGVLKSSRVKVFSVYCRNSINFVLFVAFIHSC